MAERVPAYEAAAVRAAEAPLLAAGVPLMARAAAALAALAARELPRPDARVLVLAGSGDNGGDALLAAAALASRGAVVEIVRTGPRVHDPAYAAATDAGARTIDVDEAALPAPDLVLDGILGIGAGSDPRLRGDARVVVSALLAVVSAGRTRVVAVDLPSGLHPDDGTTADDVVLPAALTVTFGAVKAGLVRGSGPELAGRLVLVDLGLDLAGSAPVAAATVSEVYCA